MALGWDKIFGTFADLLEIRLAKGRHTTEDSIRYTLFHVISRWGSIVPADVLLEYPHSNIPRAEIDCVILDDTGKPMTAIETKFHRRIPSGKNMPRPQLAGGLCKDFFRLARMTDLVPGFLVYVTDSEMASYFGNPGNPFSDVFTLQTGSVFDLDTPYVIRHAPTFVRSAGEAVPCKARCWLARNLPGHYWLRVYGVEPAG